MSNAVVVNAAISNEYESNVFFEYTLNDSECACK